MNNLITIFINHKINTLIEYVVFLYNKKNDFICDVVKSYVTTYIDNYYYGIFHTIDDKNYSSDNLKLEFNGVMEEMLYEYRQYELEVSNEEYSKNCDIIKELNNITYEVCSIDLLKYKDRDDVVNVINDFFQKHKLLNNLLENRISKFITLVKSSYTLDNRLLNYKDNYFILNRLLFENDKNIDFVELKTNIKVLDTYKPNLVSKIYVDERLDLKKIECLIHKVSLDILYKFINGDDINKSIIEIPDYLISRGKIDDRVMNLIENPLFKKYAVIGVQYNTYLNQKSAFDIDFVLACIQDFSHINDVYQKTDNILKEGLFNYLIVSECREKDRDFFIKYESESMKVLNFLEIEEK